jgi:hypothetical protein
MEVMQNRREYLMVPTKKFKTTVCVNNKVANMPVQLLHVNVPLLVYYYSTLETTA